MKEKRSKSSYCRDLWIPVGSLQGLKGQDAVNGVSCWCWISAQNLFLFKPMWNSFSTKKLGFIINFFYICMKTNWAVVIVLFLNRFSFICFGFVWFGFFNFFSPPSLVLVVHDFIIVWLFIFFFLICLWVHLNVSHQISFLLLQGLGHWWSFGLCHSVLLHISTDFLED